MSDALLVLTFLAALGCGLIGGVFFAFSTFVMKALARLPANEGIAAMQSINVVVLNRWFLGVFFGSGVLCVLLVVLALVRWELAHSFFLVLGGVLYVVGTLWVTIAFNVPRNNALAAVSPHDERGAQTWARYLKEWTAWNHVRTAAALAAAALLIISLV